MNLTDEQKAEVVRYFEGSCNLPTELEDDPDNPLTDEQVIEILLEHEVEMCCGCGWWMHQADLEEVDGDVLCENCRDEEGEDA